MKTTKNVIFKNKNTKKQLLYQQTETNQLQNDKNTIIENKNTEK